MLVLDDAAVSAALPFPECIQLMREALTALARGEVHQPLRTVVQPPTSGVMALMPAYVGGQRPAFGVKVVSIFHANPELGKDAHQGVVLLVDPATGEPQAVIDASAVTRIRTAAVSAVATDLLATADADDLAVIGAGTQARAHVAALTCVRTLRRVRVCSRRRQNSERFADDVSALLSVPVEVCDTPTQAVADASIIVTATNATEPLVGLEMVSPGAHINAVGSSIPTTRELDSLLMGAGRVYTDRLESLVNESGDFLMAARDGALTVDSVKGEVGQLLIGTAKGRQTPAQITIFKSLGLAVEDIVAARHVYERQVFRGPSTEHT